MGSLTSFLYYQLCTSFLCERRGRPSLDILFCTLRISVFNDDDDVSSSALPNQRKQIFITYSLVSVIQKSAQMCTSFGVFRTIVIL